MSVGIRRVAGEEGERAPLAAQDRAPQLLGRRREGVGRVGVDHEPTAVGDLTLELTGPPAGVAGEDPDLLQAGDGLVGIGVEVEGAHRRAGQERLPALGAAVAAEAGQADGGAGRHRAADEDDRRVGGGAGPLGKRLGDVELAGPVQDHAQRPLVAVLEDEDDGALEVGVAQVRRGDEQAALQDLGHGD